MEQKISHLLRLAGLILGLTLIVSLIVVAIGMVYRWDSPMQYSNGFFAAGAIAIVIGVLSVVGGFEQRGDFPLAYAESAGQDSIVERTQRMMADINQRYGVMILLTAVGLLLIIISIGISKFI